MPVVNSVTIGAKTIELEAFTGEVVDSQLTEYTDSHTSTDPDGRTRRHHTTTYWNKFRVKGAEARQYDLEIRRTVATVTRGDQVTLFWGVADGKDSNWLAVYNHATEHLGYLSLDVAKLAGPPFYWAILFGCGVIQFFALAGMVQGYLTAWVTFLLLCGPWYLVFQRRRAIKQAIRDAIPRLGQVRPLTTNGAPPVAHDREIRI
jgi:hypothetical protein